MKHPEVEAKVHEEIDRVIGKNRQPKFEDRVKMPYMEAVIHEIQRFGDVIPMGLAHRVNKDTKFRNFFLPKGTEVFPMLGSVLKDPRFFSNPRTSIPSTSWMRRGSLRRVMLFCPFPS
ncbi:PREDICTED: cytochrome P450 2A13-like, partial [Rhinopithecus bieti]|uniref:cytochrome P450 2A13-like n=1 Tax=Rhinopithecus bieti TaxID=61621 RepID=UPI00083C766C